jgi:hypothetical protein
MKPVLPVLIWGSTGNLLGKGLNGEMRVTVRAGVEVKAWRKAGLPLEGLRKGYVKNIYPKNKNKNGK